MKVLIASVLVLAVFSNGRYIYSDNDNETVLIFYFNSYVDEYKEPYLKYRRRYEEELRRRTTENPRIYRANHTKPYKIPAFIRFRMEKTGPCLTSRCLHICGILDYSTSYCETSDICRCDKFRCINCNDDRDSDVLGNKVDSSVVDVWPWGDVLENG